MALNTCIQNTYREAYQSLNPMMPLPVMYSDYHEDMEIWRDISSKYALGVVDNMYQISTRGRVYNKINGTILSPYKNPKGYLVVTLKCTDYKTNHRVYKVHRLVMLHFAFRPDCYLLEVDHKDTDKTNNNLSNLEWVTPQENTHRAIRMGLRQLSCTSDYTGVLLSDEEAHNLYKDMLDFSMNNSNYSSIKDIARKYHVSVCYAEDLFKGTIRPYIANKFYDRIHYDTKEEQKKSKEYYNYKKK